MVNTQKSTILLTVTNKVKIILRTIFEKHEKSPKYVGITKYGRILYVSKKNTERNERLKEIKKSTRPCS